MNWTEIAELHNDQSGFIHIEQIHIKASSSECKGSLLIHQPLRQSTWNPSLCGDVNLNISVFYLQNAILQWLSAYSVKQNPVYFQSTWKTEPRWNWSSNQKLLTPKCIGYHLFTETVYLLCYFFMFSRNPELWFYAWQNNSSILSLSHKPA